MDKTFIDNNARQKKVNTDYHNLRHNLLHAKTFFQKKYTHAGSLVNTILPVCCIYHFSLQNLQSSYLAQWTQTINRKRFPGTRITKC